MQAGFAMMEVGSVTKAGTKHILFKVRMQWVNLSLRNTICQLQNLLDMCLGVLVFYCVGYSFAMEDARRPNPFMGMSIM